MKVVPRVVLAFVVASGTRNYIAGIQRAFAVSKVAEEKDR
jgi:hypothetical protein